MLCILPLRVTGQSLFHQLNVAVFKPFIYLGRSNPLHVMLRCRVAVERRWGGCKNLEGIALRVTGTVFPYQKVCLIWNNSFGRFAKIAKLKTEIAIVTRAPLRPAQGCCASCCYE